MKDEKDAAEDKQILLYMLDKFSMQSMYPLLGEQKIETVPHAGLRATIGGDHHT